MPRWIFPLIIVLILTVILEIYTFQALKTISKSKFLRYGFLLISLAAYVNFMVIMLNYSKISNGGWCFVDCFSS
jgi:tryptophan-rich sensory protein